MHCAQPHDSLNINMTKRKIFASGCIVLGFLALSFGIAQVIANDFPYSGRWKTQTFYTTLKYFFGPYAVFVNAWIWFVIGVLFICLGAKELRVKSIDPTIDQGNHQKSTTLGRLRNRSSRRKK